MAPLGSCPAGVVEQAAAKMQKTKPKQAANFRAAFFSTIFLLKISGQSIR
jgi:hypothetical protein